jgi:hypothetical protein
VATTRFSDATWQENRQFVIKTGREIGCVYASPWTLRCNKRYIFVIEMNNSQNCILGIGLIRNHRPISQKYRVYSNNDYNRYMYLGKRRLDRADIADKQLLNHLESFCFKGKGHLKRLRGITCIDEKRWQRHVRAAVAKQKEEDPIEEPPFLFERLLAEFGGKNFAKHIA